MIKKVKGEFFQRLTISTPVDRSYPLYNTYGRKSEQKPPGGCNLWEADSCFFINSGSTSPKDTHQTSC